jgi:predicted acylesterase/phospholipase RssA
MGISRAQFFSFTAGLAASTLSNQAKASVPPWYPLPPPLPSGARTALVLSGAGARGAYEAGALKWLYRDITATERPFNAICGSSAGAINAAFAAAGSAAAIERLEELWMTIASADILQLEPPVQDIVNAGLQVQEAAAHGFPSNLSYYYQAQRLFKQAGDLGDIDKLGGAVSDTGVRALVKRYPLDLETLQATLFITATNITRMTSQSFYKFVGAQAADERRRFLERVQPRSGLESTSGAPPLIRQFPLYRELTGDSFADALVASISMPGVFKPVAVRGLADAEDDRYVDGGVVNNLSVSLAAETGASDITILMATAPGELPENETTLFGVLHEVYTLMHEQILQDDINLAIARNLARRDRARDGLNQTARDYLGALQQTEWQPLRLRVIRPRSALALTTMGFNHQQGIEAAFAQGYQDASHPYLYEMG